MKLDCANIEFTLQVFSLLLLFAFDFIGKNNDWMKKKTKQIILHWVIWMEAIAPFRICMNKFELYKSTQHVEQLNYFPSSVSNYETVITVGYRSMCNGVVYFQSKSRLSYFDGSALNFQLRKRNHIEHYVLRLKFFPRAIAVASFVSLSLTGLSLNWITVMLH